jgi:two-component system phosphate regulon response regulator PhoB
MATPSDATDDAIHVLFIEDDPAVAEMYKLKLELDGYLVTVASPGDDVGELARQARPELIFLDAQRHQDSGIATLSALRAAAQTSHVPVIILSGQHPRDLAASGYKADVMDYVVQADLTLSSLSRDLDQWATVARNGIPA